MIQDITFYCVQYQSEGGDWRWVPLSEDFVLTEGPLQYPFRGFATLEDAKALVKMLERTNLENKIYRVVEVNGYSQIKEIDGVLQTRGDELHVLRPVST